ncbi:hypothetical protein BTI82_04885 [Lactobacillus delbrueckii subsp. bulgaricus]|nr:hypothetical protein [Lactobacillus delbrueckii subsp. bulgaricus]
MIRVLHIGLSSNPGGIEKVVYSWATRLPQDIRFDFVNVDKAPLAYESYFTQKYESNIYQIQSRKNNPLASSRELTSIIRNNKYDFVHFHIMSLSWPEPILISDKNSTKTIVHSHMVVDENMSIKYQILHKIGMLRTENVNYIPIACGYEAGKSMFGKRKFEVLPNGIDLKQFNFSEEKRRKVREKLGVSDCFVIGHVGRPGRQKNYPAIMNIYSNVRKIRPESKLLLIGDLVNDEEINQLINRLDLNKDVIFTGAVDDTSQYYNAMDAFLFPSLYEGFSVSLVEAQANGVPCVVSDQVAEESKLSDLVHFFSLNNYEKASQMLCSFPIRNIKEYDNSYMKAYDVNVTAQKMFDIYRKNISRL